MEESIQLFFKGIDSLFFSNRNVNIVIRLLFSEIFFVHIWREKFLL